MNLCLFDLMPKIRLMPWKTSFYKTLLAQDRVSTDSSLFQEALLGTILKFLVILGARSEIDPACFT